MKSPLHVGVLPFKPEDLTKNQGHAYGAGRKTEAHNDRRSKRRRTRDAQRRDSLKGW